jgi:hypothetical protein
MMRKQRMMHKQRMMRKQRMMHKQRMMRKQRMRVPRAISCQQRTPVQPARHCIVASCLLLSSWTKTHPQQMLLL